MFVRMHSFKLNMNINKTEKDFFFLATSTSFFFYCTMSSKIQSSSEYLKDNKQPALVDESSVASYDTTEPPKFRKAMYLSAIVAAVGGFVCGYDTGSVSGILAMPQFTENFFTDENITYLQGLLLALYLMTAALGAFFSGFFCGKII